MIALVLIKKINKREGELVIAKCLFVIPQIQPIVHSRFFY